MATRRPRNAFAKAAVDKADEIGHPVDEATREDAAEPTLYEGLCEGGPMDGMPGQSRFPKGFVVIDSKNSRAWVYDYDAESNLFLSRKRDVFDRMRGLQAAEGANYDVRAFDRREMKGDLR